MCTTDDIINRAKRNYTHAIYALVCVCARACELREETHALHGEHAKDVHSFLPPADFAYDVFIYVYASVIHYNIRACIMCARARSRT